MDIKSAIGEVIKEIRAEQKVSQEQLGASQTYVSNVESGKKLISLDKLEEFACSLNTHPLVIIVRAYAKDNNDSLAQELLDLLRRNSRHD
ncbi:helix-turn-helix domain-containing protein [Pseudomonas putida]|nr:helix-turn-helix transcriptional regulator [Pseudomonas putida]